MVYRSEIGKSHALERSTAQKLWNSTRGDGPPLGNGEISRAGEVHRPGIAESRALEWSTARELRNLTRWDSPPLRNRGISRAGAVYRLRIVHFYARDF